MGMQLQRNSETVCETQENIDYVNGIDSTPKQTAKIKSKSRKRPASSTRRRRKTELNRPRGDAVDDSREKKNHTHIRSMLGVCCSFSHKRHQILNLAKCETHAANEIIHVCLCFSLLSC